MPDQEFKIHVISDADNSGFKSSGAATDDLTQATKKSTAATADDAEASKKTAKEVEGLNIKKRELLESAHTLTREFPLLGEIMRAVYNPMAFTIFGIIAAFEIWTTKVRTLTEEFSEMVLPNFGAHLRDAENVATAYDGIAKSVKGADDEFNSAATAFERQQKAIEAQLAATTALIAAQKQKAIADLDMERASGKVGPAMYDAKKSIIEQGYNDKTVQAEIDARNADLAARKAEQQRDADDAAKSAAKARAIKLPQDDKAVDAQIAELDDLINARKKDAEKKRADAEKQREIAGDVADTFSGGFGHGVATFVRTAPEVIGQIATHGGADPAQHAALLDAEAKAADEQVKAAEQAKARIEKEKSDREKLRKDAEKQAADAEKLRLENAGQDDPNKVGSVAWQNAQAKKAQGVKDSAAQENRFTKDIDAFNKDANEFQKYARQTDPQSIAAAHKAMQDMLAAVTDAMSVVTSLAGTGSDVAQMRADIAMMKTMLANLQRQTAAMPGQSR